MKKLLAAITILFAMTISANVSASYCEAQSPSAYGWGQSNSMEQACRIAVYECRLRTPYWDTCWITYRDWE